MASRNFSAFGIYPSSSAAAFATETLERAGFRNTDISAMYPENTGNKDLTHVKSTKSPECASAIGAAGAAIGAGMGWLAGAGMLMTLSVDALIAAGPVLSALAGAGVGAVGGGLAGALAGLSMPEYEVKRFDGRTRNAGVLLSVHCDNRQWLSRARLILHDTGAQSIGSNVESEGDFATTEKPFSRGVPAA